jgi:hypothetical protein
VSSGSGHDRRRRAGNDRRQLSVAPTAAGKTMIATDVVTHISRGSSGLIEQRAISGSRS